VCNGFELGGGSIRIHQPALQERVFALLGLSPVETEQKFGFLLKALRLGAPPHGGIALGLDRIAMILTGSDAIRDVIVFPKTQRATCLLTGSPSPLPAQALAELHLQWKDLP
jgi:aspartyl-tRNA synthetase